MSNVRNMTEMKGVLNKLLNSRRHRLDFYDAPVEWLDAHGARLPAEDRAILFTMNRTYLKRKVTDMASDISKHHFSGHWASQGRDWPAPTGDWTKTVRHPSPEITTIAPHMVGAGGAAGSAWADPGPHGRGFKPTSASIGETFTLTLVGEGFLNTATVQFDHVERHRQPTGNTAFPVEYSHYANFRRCYVRCDVTIDSSWAEGLYTITVQNDPDNEETHIKAGHFFRVEA